MIPSVAGTPVERAASAALTALVVVIAIAALYVGRDIFIPLALAVVLSFALGPLATRLRRWGLGRIAGVSVTVLLAFLAIGGLAVLVGSNVIQLARDLPSYQYNIRQKLHAVQSAAPSGGVIDRALTVVRQLANEFSEPAPGAAPGQAAAPRQQPLTVLVEEPAASPLRVIGDIAGPLLSPIATAGLVIVFVVLILLEGDDMRDRLIGLAARSSVSATSEALNDAGERISRYLLMHLIVNASFGVPIGIGLYLIGIPNALLWGVLATLLRFVPFVGPLLAALFPLAIAFAIDPGWSLLLWAIGLFLLLELITSNFVEPRLYGTSTGVSNVAIILGAIFWTSLWGPIGLVLSTPLTVCLVVMGRHVPKLAFLSVLLGKDAVLTPEERLYQRMLAGDVEGGEEIAKEELRTRTLASLYDDVVLPALRLAARDRYRSSFDGDNNAVVADSFLEMLKELDDHEGEADRAADDSARAVPAVTWRGEAVLCIAGRSRLDRVPSAMLAQLLERRGIGARALSADSTAVDSLASLDLGEAKLVCLSYLGASGVVRARQASRRLRRHAPLVKILVGLWSNQIDAGKGPDQAAGLAADFIAGTLVQACERIEALASVPLAAPMLPAPIPAEEAARLAALRRLAILDTAASDRLDLITLKLAEALDAPIGLLSLVDAERVFWLSASGLPPEVAASRGAARSTSLSGHVVAAGKLLVVADVLTDERFANNPVLREHGIRFYAGAPLRTHEGHAIGALAVLDTKPHRAISPRDVLLLQKIAADVVVQLESAPAAVEGEGSGEAAAESRGEGRTAA